MTKQSIHSMDCRVGLCFLAMTVVFFFIATAPAQAQDITTGLIGHWRLDETSGTTATNEVGANGTLLGGLDAATDSVAGKASGALNFNGSSDYIDTNINTDFSSGGYTLSAWVKTSATGQIRILSKYNTGGNQKWLMLQNGAVECGLTNGNGGVPATGSGFDDGQWHLITCVVDNTDTRIYVDGVLEDTDGHDNTFNANAITWQIGRLQNNSEFWNGAIDDVRIYSRALTAADVAQLYRSWDGHIDYHTDYRVPEYYNGNNWVAMGERKYIPNAVTFDGTNDYLQDTSLSGSDPSLITGSFWVKRDPANLGTSQVLVHYRNAAGEYFRIRFNASDELTIDGQETGVGVYNTIMRAATPITDGNWHHVVFSLDSTTRATDQIYVDDVSDVSSNPTTYSAFGGGDQASIGAFGSGSNKPYVDIADLWIDFDTKVDLSVEANRRKFIDENGNPVYLGADGSLPTGSAPELYLTGGTATWHTNKGTLGGFTENGALTDAASDPKNASPITGVPSGCPTAGDNCSDGTYYAGLSPDGSIAMYMTNVGYEGSGLSWNNDTANYTYTSATSLTDGDGNTSHLASLNDIASPHNAAIYCNDLAAHGYDDWYMPAQDEMDLIYNGGSPLGDIYVDGRNYWTSTQVNSNQARAKRMTLTYFTVSNKTSNMNVRCVRKGPAPRCTNPGAVPGKIIYNSDNQVLQYCDPWGGGNGWQAMGPVPGAGSGGCSNPSRAEGSLIFNADNDVMQYCDGDEWIRLGK